MKNGEAKFLGALVLAGFAAAPALFSGDGDENWVVVWSTALVQPGILANVFQLPGAVHNQTIRNIVHPSAGGHTVRVRLSNAFGAAPVTFDAIHIGIQKRGANLLPGSGRPVTFGSGKSVTIREGAAALSDPVSLTFAAGQNLAVSLYISGTTGAITSHSAAFQSNFVSGPGNFSASETENGFRANVQSWLFLSGVEVLADSRISGALVAFGDSITDGDRSTVDGNKRWPDALARRLALAPDGPVFSVVNAGIAGNRLLGNSPCFGAGALARLDVDVIAQTGVRAVILLEGINDIAQPDIPKTSQYQGIRPCLAQAQITSEEMIAGYKQIILQVHAKALKIFGGTLCPYQGFIAWTRDGEAKRVDVNNWIKTSGAFDGVFDFAAAIADPHDPFKLARDKDSGDHLHPNDVGYAALANAIDLSLLRRVLR
jgi:lysophospholipase L1-like esterase